jgi:hypothetical protein
MDRVAEMQDSVIVADVPIQAIETISWPFDMQDQTSAYMIYCWICRSILTQEFKRQQL